MMKKIISIILAVMLLSTFAVVALAEVEATPAPKEFEYAYDCSRDPAFPSVQGGTTKFSMLKTAHEAPASGTWTLTEAGTFSDFEGTANEGKVSEVCGYLAEAYGEAKKDSLPIYEVKCGGNSIGTGYVALVATYKYEYEEGKFADVWFAVMDTHTGCSSVKGGYGYLFSTVELTDDFAVEPDEVVGEEVEGIEVTVTVSPKEVEVKKGDSQEFTAVVTAKAAEKNEEPSEPGIDEKSADEELEFDASVTWSLEGAEAEDTVIDDNGVLTVSEDETAEEITVIATSNEDSSVSDEATVTVVSPKKPEKPESTPCEHELDENGKCSECGIIITYNNGSAPEAETNPNTGAENTMAIALAAVVLSAAAVVANKRK